MDNIMEILKLMSNNNLGKESQEQKIPKEILDQYPYGEFPIRYTRSGQESIRKNSESRFLNSDNKEEEDKNKQDFDLSTILGISSLLSGKKRKPQDMLEVFSSILFKDKPELKNMLKLFSPKQSIQEIKSQQTFPDTNKVCISTLKKVE